jgi:hypothetical protein
MTSQAQELLRLFDLLSDGDKQEVVGEIFRRAAGVNITPLSENDLVDVAEQVFLQIDLSEQSDAS